MIDKVMARIASIPAARRWPPRSDHQPPSRSATEVLREEMRIATESAERAEGLAQSRLNNFLLADSIVFLSWATLFGTGHGTGRVPVLLGLACLSSILSLMWMGLGYRLWMFIELRLHVV